MKSSHEVESIEELCRLLRQSKLLTTEEVEALLQRWRAESHPPGDLAEFTRWLIAGRRITDYQAGRLLRGRDSNFFLAGYKLLDQLSRGKHTVIYKGVDRVGRVAALKVLPASQTSDPRTLAQFLREAKRGRDLTHPNLVGVIESGEDRGAHYLIMEYLEGETLQKVLRSRPRLPVNEAIDLGLQVLAALAYLHERGLVHRNLTPANLMLVSPGDADVERGPEENLPVVKILDLGLSRGPGEEELLEPGGAARVQEALRGSVAYLAPEVVREPAAADIRADLYSLGCILYHVLAGQTPFPDPNPELQVLHHATDLPRPLQEVNPELPEELARIVARLMARAPEHRYTNPTQAADALRAWPAKQEDVEVNVEPVHLPPTTVASQAELQEAVRQDDYAQAGVRAAPPPIPPPPEPSAVEVEQQPAFVPAFDLGGPIASAPVVAAVPVRRPQRRADRGLGLDRRDWLLLLAGAGALLLVQALAWLIARLTSASRDQPGQEE